MVKITTQKRMLIGLCIASVLFGIGIIIGGIALIVTRVTALLNEENVAICSILILLGALLAIFFLVLIGFGVYWLLVACAMKATNGSIKDGNQGNGTLNMKKCPYCGAEIEGNETFCPNCAHSLSDTKLCPKCGATNKADNNNCTVCGAEL